MLTIKQQLLSAIDHAPIEDLESTLTFLNSRLNLRQPKPDYPTRAVSVLRQLAQTNTVAGIEDPIAWQTEIRTDRPLPGRND
jgi:hypothetical protein